MASQGPLLVGTGADDATVGTLVWATPTNITAADDARATRAVATTLTTHYLKGTNCGFTIPAGATIDGIIVEIERHKTGAASQVRDSAVRIVKADGSIGSTNKGATSTDWPNTAAAEAIATYGGAADKWGETWTVADINDADFGAVVAATNPSATTGSGLVDFIRITVHYTAGATTHTAAASVAGAGTVAGTATRTTLAVGALNGTGTVAAAATRITTAQAAISGTGSWNAVAGVIRVGAAALGGTGSISATGTRTAVVVAPLAGQGTIAASATRTALVEVAIAGAGTISATFLVVYDVWPQHDGEGWNQDTDDLWQTTSEGSWAGV